MTDSAMGYGKQGQGHPTNSMHDEFFRAYGSAMFAWQEVETALFKLYHSMNVLDARQDIMVSAKAYYTKKSFGLKRELVNKLARDVNVKTFIDWDSLNRDLKSESVCRNSLAHRPAQLVERPDGSVSLELGDPIFFPLSLGEIPAIAFPYDTNGCWGLCRRFKDLAQRVDAACGQIPHKFANNQLIRSDSHKTK